MTNYNTKNNKKFKPGAYQIGFDEYLAAEGVSNSQLKEAAKSMARWKRRYIDNIDDDGDKRHFVVGRALHTKVLEPDKFDIFYAVAPAVDRRTKAGKEKWAAFVESNAKKEILTAEEYDTVVGATESILCHPRAGSYFIQGTPELSFFTVDKRTGLPLKCRTDWLSGEFAFDIKSTISAEKSSFFTQIARLKYYLQAALYLDIINEFTDQPVEEFVFIAVEKTPPYLVGVYPIDERSLQLGRMEYRYLLDKINFWHQQQGLYPGYNDDEPVTVSLPGWAFRAVEEACGITDSSF